MVDVSCINSEAPDELFVRRIMEEIKRLTPRRGWNNEKIRVTTGGISFKHDLGYIPKHITFVKLSEMHVWHYIQPDGRYLHLKSDVDGDVLISLSGE